MKNGKQKWNGCKELVKRFVQEEEAIGVVEVVLILLVLVGLVLIFRENIQSILANAFEMVTDDMDKLEK